MPATFERTVPDGGRRMEGLPPPVTSRSMSVDGFRRILPEGLPSRMHEIHAEPGAAGSKSQYSSPSPLRAPQSRSGRRLSLPSKSPQELLAVQKSHLFFARLPPVTHGPLSDSPAAGATPARTRSLETILKKQAMSTRTRSLEGRFSWAAADESPSSTPSSSPWGDTLRSVVSSPERHAGKTLKPLPVRRNSVTKGQELPPGLRRWSHSEIVGVDGNLLIRTAAEFFDLINRPAPLPPPTRFYQPGFAGKRVSLQRHKFSEVADMLGKECKWKCSDESACSVYVLNN
ncbi:hypothetical protein T484DRAFT_1741133 [Baffinella frigidus]|nr:hypothetical protein T484DRAFT_1741133 [Cryptophyta sp. CCMP2293]